MPKLEINGAILHYHRTGKKGIPIVFIHPPLLTTQTFNYQKAQLSDEFQVITFDIRGHGESEASERKVTYPLIVDDIVGLLDALSIPKAYLCGYSTGGSVVLAALLAHPNRFLGGIIVSGMSEVNDRYNKSLIWLATQMAAVKPLRNVLSAALSYGNADMGLTYHNLRGSSIRGNTRNQHEYFQSSYIYNCTSRLKYIEHPVLLIYGQKNANFHPYAHLLHDNLPNSSLYFIKDANHQIPLKEPGRMNDLIRLWVESLQDRESDRNKLDWQIARKLNPEMYAHNEDDDGIHVR